MDEQTKTTTYKTVNGLKLGRKRSAQPAPLHFKNYLIGSALPTPPATCDYTAAAMTSLNNIFLNDQLGDCVIAGAEHYLGVITGNAGNLFIPTNAQVIAEYGSIGGYNPNNPFSDQGCDMQTAMNYYVSTGFANNTKLTSWIAVDPTNQTELQLAIYLFEGLYFGMELPNAWLNADMPQASGFTWDVAGNPDPENGHCVTGVGYNANGIVIDTWGMLGTLTWAAIAEYASANSNGELYILISQGALNKTTNLAPNGFNWSQLVADFDALGGSITPVTPTTTATTISLASSVNPSNVGQATTLSSNVKPATGTAVPTGTVTFNTVSGVNATSTLDNTGQTSVNVSNLPQGSNVLTAAYSGDANFTGSISPALTQVVNPTIPPPTPTSVTVAFGVYELTITAISTDPTPVITPPSPITVTIGNQTLTITGTVISSGKTKDGHNGY